MRSLRVLITLMACAALCAPALAATLVSTGKVLVNRGSGYQTIYGSTELKPSDLVVVDPGGAAQITYPDGCSVAVEVGALVTVGAQSPCAAASGAGGFGGAGIFILNAGVAAGVVGAVLLNQNKDKPASP